MTLEDELAKDATGGAVDATDIIGWDAWVAYMVSSNVGRRRGDIRMSNDDLAFNYDTNNGLVSWAHPSLCDNIQHAINTNASEGLRWMDLDELQDWIPLSL